MVKQTEIPIMIGGSILLIALLLALSSFSIQPGSTASGTALSISNIHFTEASEGWTNQDIWSAQVVLGVGSDILVGGTKIDTPLTQLIDQATGIKAENNLRVSYELVKEQFEYPLASAPLQPQYKKIQGVNFELKPNYNYGTTSLGPNTYLSLSCAQKVILTRTITGDIPTVIPTECQQEYRVICNKYGGKMITATSSINIFGINIAPTTGYMCVKVVDDTSKPTLSFFRPTQINPKVQANVYVYNGLGQEIITLTETETVKKSANTRVSMVGGLDAFQTYVPEYSSFYVLKTSGINLPIEKSIYNNIGGFATSDISDYDTQTSVNSKLSAYNVKLNNIIVNKQTGFLATDEIMKAQYGTSSVIVDRTGKPSKFPVLSIEVESDWLGVERQIAEPSVSVSPSSITLREGGAGSIVDAKVTIDGEGSVILQPPVCSPSGITATPSGAITKSYNFEQEYIIRGNEGQYSCTIKATDTDGDNPSIASFSVNILEKCSKTPINGQVLNYETCILTCPIVCGSGQTKDYVNCVCITPDTTKCSNSCPTGQLQKPWPICTCYEGECEPDLSTKIEGGSWSTVTCSWECPQGTIAILNESNKVVCSSGCITDIQCNNNQMCKNNVCIAKPEKEDNTLLIAGLIIGGLILVSLVGYGVFTVSSGKGRR